MDRLLKIPHLKGFILAYLLLLILAIANLYPVVASFFKIQPYSNVERVLVEEGEGVLHVSYIFEKNGACEIKDFSVRGTRLGVTDYLTYKDINPEIRRKTEELGIFDRHEGFQFLNITIDTPESYDRIDLITRHFCTHRNGDVEVVDKVFTSIDLNGV